MVRTEGGRASPRDDARARRRVMTRGGGSPDPKAASASERSDAHE